MNLFSQPQLPAPISPQQLLSDPKDFLTQTVTRKDIFHSLLAYLFFAIPMFFVPKENEFVWFNIRQCFGMFIASLVVYLIHAVFGLLLLALVLNIALAAIWCIGIAHVLGGKAKTLPVIGNVSEKYKIF